MDAVLWLIIGIAAFIGPIWLIGQLMDAGAKKPQQELQGYKLQNEALSNAAKVYMDLHGRPEQQNFQDDETFLKHFDAWAELWHQAHPYSDRPSRQLGLLLRDENGKCIVPDPVEVEKRVRAYLETGRLPDDAK